jgi:predicted transcriptional regulator of viral defense system
MILTGDKMLKDHRTLMQELSDYASPKARLTRMIRSGKMLQVRRGLFLEPDDGQVSLKSLASVIYGPSYISFQYALSHYGLIPERVSLVTSAVYGKNKNRLFNTPFGDFAYYYLPSNVYPYEVVRETENRQPYLIATAEKALCDSLYKVRGVTTETALVSLLLDDWRIERDRISEMDSESLNFLAPLYGKRIMTVFLKWYNREVSNA